MGKYDSIGEITADIDFYFNREANILSYLATDKGKSFWVINNQSGERFDYKVYNPLWPKGSYAQWSQNGKNFVYIAKKDNSKQSVVINNNEEKEYLIVSSPFFVGNTTVRYFVYDGQNIYRITKVIK